LPGAARFPRRIATIVVWAIVAVLLARTWFIEGLISPLVVSGGSMAETLLGPHREIVCRDCGRRFVCDADVSRVSPRAVCPNCGCAENDPESLPDLAGDHVLVDKAIFRVRPPRRWEVVAFRNPQRAERVEVKRVVGLPGETVQIREGDVYIDGQIARKPLSTQRAMALLVHDASSTPRRADSAAARWRADRPEVPWGTVDGRFAHPETPQAESTDWLTYNHVCRIGGQDRDCPVSDVCGYNQSTPRRVEDTHDVTDLLLALRVVRVWGEGEMIIRATDGAEQFEIVFYPERRQFEVRRHGRPNPVASGEVEIGSEPLRIEISLFDRQLCVALDRCPVVVFPYDPADEVRRPNARPFSIGTRGLGLEIDEVKVYRDVYYTDPIGPKYHVRADSSACLGRDEYYVLGDNSPVSEDSRTWARGPAVPATLVVGKPFLVLFAMREVDLGPWRFPVPDPTRMRYIR
jgi:signal peptidase I